MKIYTKTGDKGETGLFGGERVSKSDPRIEAYGTVDELNATVGVALAALEGRYTEELQRIQSDLFNVGAELAARPGSGKAAQTVLLEKERIGWLEQEIDKHEASLPALRNFILPGGSPGAAALHLSRTVCRRAERAIVSLAAKESVRGVLIEYMNRLSDYFFTLARLANQDSGIKDVEWKK